MLSILVSFLLRFRAEFRAEAEPEVLEIRPVGEPSSRMRPERRLACNPSVRKLCNPRRRIPGRLVRL